MVIVDLTRRPHKAYIASAIAEPLRNIDSARGRQIDIPFQHKFQIHRRKPITHGCVYHYYYYPGVVSSGMIHIRAYNLFRT